MEGGSWKRVEHGGGDEVWSMVKVDHDGRLIMVAGGAWWRVDHGESRS